MLVQRFTLLIVGLVTAVGCMTVEPQPPRRHVPAAMAIPASDQIAFEEGDHTVAVPAAATDDQARSATEQFDLALMQITKNGPAESFSSLPPDQRDLIASVIDAVRGFRHSLADPDAPIATRTAPLMALTDQLESQLPLTIPTLAICKSVAQFGVYEPVTPAQLPAGVETPLIVYCELDRFHSRPASDGRWETRLTYEAVVYRDGDNAVSVLSRKPSAIVDRCRNRRQDFFLADRMTFPGDLPAGKYVLKVTVVDKAANRVAEKSLPILVAAPAKAE